MIIAKWQNKEDFACFSNTIDGAISCLLSFVAEAETGIIYIYKDDKLIEKVHKIKNKLFFYVLYNPLKHFI